MVVFAGAQQAHQEQIQHYEAKDHHQHQHQHRHSQQSDEITGTDTKALAKRLQRKWEPQSCINELEGRIKEYAGRPQSRMPTRDGGALQILSKAIKDGEASLHLQDSELAAVEVMKTGMRDFIDDAMAEVDRFAAVVKSAGSSLTSFNWRSQGSAKDNPALRVSQATHNVGDFWQNRNKQKADTFREVTSSVWSLRNDDQNPARFSVV